MSLTFAQLGVPDSICSALARRGITKPFEIQAATIRDALTGRDVCGRAPTGSGKTLAFGIPLVATAERASAHQPHSLVLAPTRELADQITRELRTFAGPIRVGVVYGGVGYGPQLDALRRGVDILVACPGRLEDLIGQGAVDLSAVDRVVLDEADRMADMGFMPAVRRLLDQVSDPCQTMLFSATLDGDVAELTRNYQRDPVRHQVGEETPDITAARHVFWNVTKHERIGTAADAVNAAWPAIIFCRTRHGADRVARQLTRAGIRAAAIHGGRTQPQRERTLADFMKGRVHALVATDVAARGIHVDGVASVIHYDPPADHKTYLHRSGRTARAGRGGVVLSLVQPEHGKELQRMQRQLGLHEPLTDPDAVGLRLLAPGPDRAAASTGSHDDRRAKVSTNRPKQRRTAGQVGRSRDGRARKRNASNGRGPKRNASNGRGPKRNASNGRGRSGKTGSTGRSRQPAESRSGSARPNRRARRAHPQGAAKRR